MHTCYGLMRQGMPEARFSDEVITDFRASAKPVGRRRSMSPGNGTSIGQ